MSEELREKVIKAMECCVAGAECDHCPYSPTNKSGYEGCYQLHADAIALLKDQQETIWALEIDLDDTLDVMCEYAEKLKAQESMKPVLDIDTWKCSNCGHTWRCWTYRPIEE